MPRGKVGAVSAEWPLACPERLDQTRSEGRTGEDRRIQPESGAKTVAAQPRLGYAGLAGMAKMEILVDSQLTVITLTNCDCTRGLPGIAERIASFFDPQQ